MKHTITFLFLLSAVQFSVQAKDNDTIRVVSHDKVLMVTDPARGVNEVLKWVKFPNTAVPYRKVTAHLTMQCPEGMKCGAWDYLDYVIVRRQGGTNSPARKDEILRFLTPYGSWLDKDWKFTWSQDVTDWGTLLRDSVEIEYQHTGYEDNQKLGWLVTLEFEIVTGRPVMEALGYDALWNASFAYGDTLRPFDTLVKPVTLNVPEGAKRMNYRIMQTGHGMDRPGNCSEFCPKWRDVYFDNQLINHRGMTIVCGTNSLYPQSGTWIYARSNWCPGSLSVPDVYTLPVEGRQHTLDLKMEPYISNNPSGGWMISANAFYYKDPSAKNDAALEDIITPSTKDYHNRLNPVLFSPRILIKNNGSRNLEKLTIEYGLKGQKKQVYEWRGNLPFLQTEEVTLPGSLDINGEESVFEVKLSKPNGKKDEYVYDNFGQSIARQAPMYGDSIVVSFLTNNVPGDTRWYLKDAYGNIRAQQPAEGDTLRKATLYSDTLALEDGYYEWVMEDKSDNGLYYWANPMAGYGYVRLQNTNGELLKAFDSDFGTFIRHSFRVKKGEYFFPAVEDTLYITSQMIADQLGIDLVLHSPSDIQLKITDPEGKQVFQSLMIKDFRSRILQIDVASLPIGTYLVTLETAEGKVMKKMMRKAQERMRR